MPADIFQPRHFLNLVAYAELTISTYINPNERATALVLGQCSGIGYSLYNGILSDVSWFGDGGTSYGRFGRMMGSVCAVQCACDFRKNGPGALPACIDLPDYPSSGRFCSLCGPSTACGSAGCSDDGNIRPAHPIHLYNKGPAECQPRGSACPPASEDSTSNDATAMHRSLQATVDANGDHHLYFHAINEIMRTCGHVDAAPFMPAELFEPEVSQLSSPPPHTPPVT
jgi:hypothetical protein